MIGRSIAARLAASATLIALIVGGAYVVADRHRDNATEQRLANGARAAPYGDFLLVPVGATHHGNTVLGPIVVAPVEELTVDAIRAAPLYKKLRALTALAGAQETLTARRVGDGIVEIRASYMFDAPVEPRSVEIVLWKPRIPVEVELPVAGGAVTFARGSVGGDPAVFYESSAGAASTDIWFMHDGVLTQVTAPAGLEPVLRLAESLR